MTQGPGSYKPPFWLFNHHLETIIPAVFRRVDSPDFIRQTIETPDNDFLDLDLALNENRRAVIISHGLEGNSRRPYMLGMAKKFFDGNFDVCNWNFRSCSGRMNKNLMFYHSGATYDLETVVNYMVSRGYEELYLIGFSLGGNMTLKYLGEKGDDLHPLIKGAVAISVPMDLLAGSKVISESKNFLYEWRFLRNLKKKIKLKANKLPLDIGPLKEVKRLKDFDEFYTAPLHGFHGAEDYYAKNSSMFFLEGIRRPVLLIQSRNDSFLTENCFPEAHPEYKYVDWLVTNYGGHVGFSDSGAFFSENQSFYYLSTLSEL